MAAACALAIISRKNIFNRAMPERLRTLRHCIFTGGVVEGNGRCNAGFLRKHPRCGVTPSVIACGDATFPKGTASAVAENSVTALKGVPLGELAANAVSRLRG